jgi:hypothetical protein
MSGGRPGSVSIWTNGRRPSWGPGLDPPKEQANWGLYRMKCNATNESLQIQASGSCETWGTETFRGNALKVWNSEHIAIPYLSQFNFDESVVYTPHFLNKFRSPPLSNACINRSKAGPCMQLICLSLHSHAIVPCISEITPKHNFRSRRSNRVFMAAQQSLAPRGISNDTKDVFWAIKLIMFCCRVIATSRSPECLAAPMNRYRDLRQCSEGK